MKTWWRGIRARAEEIDRDQNRPPRRPAIRNSMELQDEAIAQAVSSVRNFARGLWAGRRGMA